MASSQFNPILWQNVNLDDPRQIREFMRQLVPYLAWLQQRLIVLLNAPPSTGGGGGGDMLKSTYDTNNNGIVDSCDALPYGRLTGVPSAFPPSGHAPTHLDNGTDPIPVATATRTGSAPKLSGTATTFLNGNGGWTVPAGTATGDMTKAVYDTNNNNVVDTCDSLPYSSLTGVPTSFAPSAHASTHISTGSDPIAVATTGHTGLVPVLNGAASVYLDGTGNWSAPPGGGITDAPSDGGLYARQNGAWATCQTQKPMVATSSALPTTGNSYGDMRIAQDTGHGWVWTKGTPDSWVDAGALLTPLAYYEWTYPGGST